MPKVTALVEGQTEETFVREVLDPYLRAKSPDFFLHAILVQTKRVNSGGAWRGGITKYRQFRDQVRRLLNDRSSILVTSVIDLYHLPSDFPGFDEAANLGFRQRVAFLERSLSEDLGQENFFPYISTHEFEALVLSDPHILGGVLGESPARVDAFANTLRQFTSPEQINGESAPSVRILSAFPQYDKVRHGPLCTTNAGLSRIRAQCEHFDSWVRRLEALLTL